MALQLYADGRLVYDSRLEDYKLLSLKTTEGLNKAGTAEFTMPCRHPAYNAFVSLRTVVTLYENDAMKFRGRVLYPSDDWLNCRTIVCEGERGFLQDASIRPYLFQDSPVAIFTDALTQYNADVDEFKRFSLGSVTVTDSNDYVRLESESAETFFAFFEKLVERCGGYITFSDDKNGGRAINWLAEVGEQSQQPIEFGSNLLDFSRSGHSPELATAVRPYGAQLEDGGRVTIASVTQDGADWIKDDEAASLRGIIMATPTWDDVTTPEALLRKAQAWLQEHRQAITSLHLSGVDLSKLDRSIKAYSLGDWVPVRSVLHNVDTLFQLTDRETDWFDLSGGYIDLGKTQTSLTGLDVEGDRQSASALDKVKGEIINDYKINIESAVTEATRTMTSLIQQNVDSISAAVSETQRTFESTTESIYEEIDDVRKETIKQEDLEKTKEAILAVTSEEISAAVSETQQQITTTTENIYKEINGLRQETVTQEKLEETKEVIFDVTSDGISAAVSETQKSIVTTTENIYEEINGIREESVTRQELEKMQKTAVDISSEKIEMNFAQVSTWINELDGTVEEKQRLLEEYIRFVEGRIELGRSDSQITAVLQNDRLSFLENGQEVAYISNAMLYVTDIHVLNRIRHGNADTGYYDWEIGETGTLDLVYSEV